MNRDFLRMWGKFVTVAMLVALVFIVEGSVVALLGTFVSQILIPISLVLFIAFDIATLIALMVWYE